MSPADIRIDRDKTALLLVDLQPGFMPGGAPPVDGGDSILSPIRDLMMRDLFALYLVTQDWHLPGQASFASALPGHRPFDVIQLHGKPQTLWPDHCLQGSPGATLQPQIPWDKVAAFVRTGMEPDVYSYSGFRNNWGRHGGRPPTGLDGYLRERGIGAVFVCGLARDVCVIWTAEDAVAAGFDTTLLWDLSRSVDPKSNDAVREDLNRLGVRVLTSNRIWR
jgi:nicotinamidase/pyrazinamidase